MAIMTPTFTDSDPKIVIPGSPQRLVTFQRFGYAHLRGGQPEWRRPCS